MIFQKLKTDESGNVGMMFGAGLLTIAGITGAALDYGNLTKAQNELQSHVDAAVLAAVSVGLREEDGYDGTRASEERIRKAVALEVMKTNGHDVDVYPPTITLTDENTIYAAISLEHQLAFGGLLGAQSKSLSAESESGLGTSTPVQIALVLDNTRSMLSGGKLAALKTGAEDLTRKIEERQDGSEIALVPFARYIRVPENTYSASWLDVPEEFDTTYEYEQATHTGGECHTETQTRTTDGFEEEFETEVCEGQTTTYETQTNTVESRFTGCVGTRTPPYSELDDSYLHKVPGLLEFIPRQHTGLEYNTTAYCGRQITPLTDDYDHLADEINAQFGTDQTYIPMGLIWGQAVLSPGEPFDNPNSGEIKRKVMIVMTDGRNSSYIVEGQGYEDAMVAPPYLVDSPNENQYSPEANTATARMCENIKGQGIEIFTIAFQVDDAETIDLLNSCASNSTMAFTAETNDALIARFQHISGSLEGNARLMR